MVNMLHKKILRDAYEHRFAFIAVICVCTLGIALFSGFNLYVSTVENELESAYEQYHLADYWVYKNNITESELAQIQSLPETARAERRKTLELPISGNENAALRLHGIEDQSYVNIPELINGSMLDKEDMSALLLDSRYADANRIALGDALQFEVNGQSVAFYVKDIVRNVEYVYYAPNGLTIPDYSRYGFAYLNAAALPQMPFNEIILTTDDAKEQSPMTAILRETLGNVSVISRSYQSSARQLESSLSGNRKIGTLFPIVFFLTAALITWTTVGRMMENQRQHLGTLRSLGFPKRTIVTRYTLYGVLVTVPSMVLGWLVSRYGIAQTLYNIATTYYTIEVNGVDLVSYHFILASLGVAAVTCGAAYLSCRKPLRFTPAALMRPKPPTAGHRMLLERITPLWKRISFSGKIVARNLFRNKARMTMGLMGIIGSAALILCGFGIMTSINAMIDKSFSEIILYDAEVKLKTALSLDETADMVKAIKGVDGFDTALSFSVTVCDANGEAQNPYLVVLEDTQASIHFKDNRGQSVTLPEQGVFITPRMAATLGVSVGGIIDAEGLDGTVFPLEVAGIVDFPVGNEIYMSQTAFSIISDIPFSVRVFFLHGADLDITSLRQDARIALIETKNEMKANLHIVLEILQRMEIILILFSGLLSLAVMMVLGRMNFDERIRELATLKVLGFHKNEMKRLVLRENVWISMIGLPFGFAVSIVLLKAVLSFATTPDLEIALSLSVPGIIAGCALIIAFTLFINSLMGRKFKRIDMVASLKSVE